MSEALVELTIDGRSVSVSPGATIMHAAKKLGIAIPHFCYHDKLSIAANCRMCLVQAEKMPKPVPACATPVMAGMKVFTQSDMAVSAQKGVMELLLINHPLDCPICDQGGECQLQDLSMGYGGSCSPYEEEKRVVVNKNLGPLIATDMTRCIQCTRCVRFGEEWGGMMELGMGNRGERSEIMTFMQGTVDSEISGNAIDLCPVGALTSKPFRFSARGWELTDEKIVAPHDSWGSRLTAQKKGDAVLRVLPDECEEINQHWLSDRDRFSYTALGREDRLTTPIVRDGTRWREISWASAIEKIVSWHQGVSPTALNIMAHPATSLEELSMLSRLGESLGVSVATALRRTDPRLNHAGVRSLGLRINEINHVDRVVLIGSFVRSEQPLLAARLRQRIRAGAQVSRINVSAEKWQMPLHAEVVAHPHDLVAQLAGVLAHICTTLNTAIPPSVQGLMAKSAHADAITDAIRAIAQSLIHTQSRAWIALGHYAENHPQASELSALAQACAQVLSAHQRNVDWGFLVSGANAMAAQFIGIDSAPNFDQGAAIYWLYGVDGAEDFALRTAAQAAFTSAQAVVRFSAFMPRDMKSIGNTTHELVLPMAAFTERQGTMINAEGCIQSHAQVVPPPGQAREGWKIIRHLAEHLGAMGENHPTNKGYAPLALLFDRDDSLTQVRQTALSRPSSGQVSLDGGWWSDFRRAAPSLENTAPATPTQNPTGFTRYTEINLYDTDEVVRRAAPLQHTATARYARELTVRIHPDDCAALGIVTQINHEGELIGQAHLGTNNGDTIKARVVVDCHGARGAVGLQSGAPFDDHTQLWLRPLTPTDAPIGESHAKELTQ